MRGIRQFFKRLIFNRPITDNILTLVSAATIDSNSSVGENTYIGKYVNITSATIGRYCSIANNVSIGMGEHRLDRISTSSFFYGNDEYATLTEGFCVIKNDVWIGVDSIIRRGVTIGNGAVVGANSFVNADVPDFAIVAGNPARIIRYRFPEWRRAKILASHWWDYDIDVARKKIAELLDE